MGLHLLSIHHADHGIEAVDRAARRTPGLGRRLVAEHPEVNGAVVLATCNRVEVYVDADAEHTDAVAVVRRALGPDVPLRARHATEVLWHLFGVGAGLDSMVVGEAEIVGQVRKTLTNATDQDSPALHRLFQMALTTSKKVANQTTLGALGRSVASVALDLAEQRHGRLTGAPALLLGTGSYAGVVTADLRRRGARVQVHSASGRAQAFAQTHPMVTPVAADELGRAIAEAKIVVSCSGTGARTISAETVLAARYGVFGILPLVDLALSRDIDPLLAEATGIDLIDLDVVGANTPGHQTAQLTRARTLVRAGVQDYLATERSRTADPAVTAIRSHVEQLITRELGHVGAHHSAQTTEVVRRSLRRMTNTLLHAPSQRAADYAKNGELTAYVAALHTVFGIEVDSE